MEFEIAKESVPDLTMVQNCTKNPNHAGFVKYGEFGMDDIPVEYRRPEILRYIKVLGKRVVRLTVEKPDGSQRFGSGVVYRGLGFHYVLTNDHVVANQTDVVKCTVDFFYDSDDTNNVVKSKGVELLICSGIHDKCVFSIAPVPEDIDAISQTDDIGGWVKVFAKFEDESSSEILGYLLKKWNEWFVLVTMNPDDRARMPIVQCEVEFQAVKAERVPSTDFDVRDEKLLVIKLDDSTVPQVIKDFSLYNTLAPWPRGNPHFVPVVIAHPHGAPKMISVGKLLAVEVTDPEKPGLVYHTAETCPGSSGGLLITLGGDILPYGGCANTTGIHREGDTQDEFRGTPIVNKNLNVSMLTL